MATAIMRRPLMVSFSLGVSLCSRVRLDARRPGSGRSLGAIPVVGCLARGPLYASGLRRAEAVAPNSPTLTWSIASYESAGARVVSLGRSPCARPPCPPSRTGSRSTVPSLGPSSAPYSRMDAWSGLAGAAAAAEWVRGLEDLQRTRAQGRCPAARTPRLCRIWTGTCSRPGWTCPRCRRWRGMTRYRRPGGTIGAIMASNRRRPGSWTFPTSRPRTD
jgi:hypothetical protein